MNKAYKALMRINVVTLINTKIILPLFASQEYILEFAKIRTSEASHPLVPVASSYPSSLFLAVWSFMALLLSDIPFLLDNWYWIWGVQSMCFAILNAKYQVLVRFCVYWYSTHFYSNFSLYVWGITVQSLFVLFSTSMGCLSLWVLILNACQNSEDLHCDLNSVC